MCVVAVEPEPVARLFHCCFLSAAPTLPPAPRAGFLSIAASSQHRQLSSSHAASDFSKWPELMARAMSGLTEAEIEPGDGQRNALHEHDVSMGGGRCSML